MIISQSSKESPLLAYKNEAKSYPRGISKYWHMLALPGLLCLFLIQFPLTSLGSQPMATATPCLPPDIYLDSPGLFRAPFYVFAEYFIFFPLSSDHNL